MLFSEATGHKVVSTSTAETVGKVDEFVIDPHSRRVVALELKKTDGGDTLTWSKIAAFGADAVTVTDAGAIAELDQEIAPLTGKHKRVIGKRVLTTIGDEVGKVADVDFDPATGALTTIVLDTMPVAAERLVGIGSYAVVVQA